MLRLAKALAVLLLILILAVIVIYFLPRSQREWILTKAAGIVPASLRESAENLLLSPQERRSRIIDRIARELAVLEAAAVAEAPTPEAQAKAREAARAAAALVEELKSENENLSLGEIAKTKLVEALLDRGASATSSEQCAPSAN